MPGILSQGIPSSLDAMLPPGHNYTTYLAASYVKWVEGAGARAAPIIVSDNEDNLDYYDQVDRQSLMLYIYITFKMTKNISLVRRCLLVLTAF